MAHCCEGKCHEKHERSDSPEFWPEIHTFHQGNPPGSQGCCPRARPTRAACGGSGDRARGAECCTCLTDRVTWRRRGRVGPFLPSVRSAVQALSACPTVRPLRSAPEGPRCPQLQAHGTCPVNESWQELTATWRPFTWLLKLVCVLDANLEQFLRFLCWPPPLQKHLAVLGWRGRPPPSPHLHLRCQAKPRAGALRAETRGGRARPGVGDCDLVCKRGPCRCREGSSDEGPSLHLMAGLPPKGREGGWRPTGAEKRQSEASEGRGGNRRVTAASRGRAPRSPQGRRLSASISSFRPPEREKKFRCSEPRGLWRCPSELVAPCPFC